MIAGLVFIMETLADVVDAVSVSSMRHYVAARAGAARLL
jgi:hypothetical protein